MKNVRKHKNIKLETTARRKKYLVPELSYHTATFFTGTLLEIEMEKNQILVNKALYLDCLFRSEQNYNV